MRKLIATTIAIFIFGCYGENLPQNAEDSRTEWGGVLPGVEDTRVDTAADILELSDEEEADLPEDVIEEETVDPTVRCQLLDDGVTEVCLNIYEIVDGEFVPYSGDPDGVAADFEIHSGSSLLVSRINVEDRTGFGYSSWEGPDVYTMDVAIDWIPMEILVIIAQHFCEEATFEEIKRNADLISDGLLVIDVACAVCATALAPACSLPGVLCVGTTTAGSVLMRVTSGVMDELMNTFEPASTMQVCAFMGMPIVIPDELYLINHAPTADGFICAPASADVGEEICCNISNLADDHTATEDLEATFTAVPAGGSGFTVAVVDPARVCFTPASAGIYRASALVQDNGGPWIDVVKTTDPFIAFDDVRWDSAASEHSYWEWGPIEVTCVPDWSCTAWSTCSCAGIQTRVCSDSNSCGVSSGRPAETRTCAVCGNGACDCGETRVSCSADCGVCVPDWSCGTWSSCSCGGSQTRTCVDLADCGDDATRPTESQACFHCGDGTCDASCEDFVSCTADCGVCAPGEGECVSSSSYRVCDITGHWGSAMACGSSEECLDDEIGCETIAICTPDSWECSGTATRRQCNVLGTGWLSDETCPEHEHCESGLCVPDSLLCVPFQEVCIGSRDWHRCAGTGMEWGASERCPSGTYCVQETADTIECRCPAEADLVSESPLAYDPSTEFVDKDISVRATLHEASSITCAEFDEHNNSGSAVEKVSYTISSDGTHSRLLSSWCGASSRVDLYYACECTGTSYINSHASDIARGVYDASKLIYLGHWTFYCP